MMSGYSPASVAANFVATVPNSFAPNVSSTLSGTNGIGGGISGTVTGGYFPPQPNICPGCGRCRDCGHPYTPPAPANPYPFGPYTPPYQPTIICGDPSPNMQGGQATGIAGAQSWYTGQQDAQPGYIAINSTHNIASRH